MPANHMLTAAVRFTRKYLPAWLLGVLCLFLAAGLSGQSAAVAPARVIAVGDVHGDYDAFVALLQRSGLLDAKLRWSGRNAVLVQTGDILDRGPKDRDVMDLLMRLEKEAAKKGGRVVVLLGNHEVMNLIGDLRYVSPATYASYADKNSEKRRQSAWKEYAEFQQARAKERNEPLTITPEMEKAWMGAHPPGYFERLDAFGPEGKYGRWLRSHSAVAQIGASIFLHGGISPALASVGVEAINKRVEGEIIAFDTFRQYFASLGLSLRFVSLEEITRAASGELERRKAELARKEAEATTAGKHFSPDPEVQKHVGYLTDFLAYPSWFSINPDGPLWFRGYAEWNDADGAAQIEKLLAANHAERFIVGHTPQRDGRIRVRFGGKVFLIDTGMLSAYFHGGRASALEMEAGKFTAVYPDQRVSLLDTSAARPAGGSDGAAEVEEGEQPGGGLAAMPRQEQAPSAPNHAAPPAHIWLGPNGEPLPFKSDEEVMEFLRKARVVKVKNIATGITHPRRVLLELDGIQVDAAFRVQDEEKTMATLSGGNVEMFFRDSYIFDLAAYELSRMLGMDNVPPVVERRLLGEKGSVQIWMENVMTETERQKKNISPPDLKRWNYQLYTMRVFDNLIYNTDRNMGNILIEKDWNVWLIDHSRAFRRYEEPNTPANLLRCERKLWERLQNLDPEEVRRRLKPYLRSVEIDALLKRRDKIVQLIRKLIAEKGEDQVLFDQE